MGPNRLGTLFETTMKLTRSQYQLLKWSQARAEELLGAHTGGPYETEYREKLTKLRKLIAQLNPRKASSHPG
jgi:hypothetical protein